MNIPGISVSLALACTLCVALTHPAAAAESASLPDGKKAASTTAAQRSAEANEVQAAVSRAFGSSVELVTGFRPYYAVADFNGDRYADLVAVVRVMNEGQLPRDVRVENPYRLTYPSSPAPALALAVLHGAAGGWSAATPRARFLLRGGSNVVVTNELYACPDKASDAGGIEVWRRTERRRRPSYLPRAARGDAIVLGTEAAEGILYWNGRRYAWVEDPEGY